MSSPLLRLAWREVTRHKGRSLLVAVLIGLPVMLSVGISTIWASSETESHPSSRFGQATAIVNWAGGPVQEFDEGYKDVSEEHELTFLSRGDAAKRAAEVTGRHVLALDMSARTTLIADDRPWHVDATVVDFTDPLARGILTLDHGNKPMTSEEVVISKHLSRKGIQVGEAVVVGGARLVVIGVSTDPYDSIAALPSAGIKTSATEIGPKSAYGANAGGGEFLVDGPQPTPDEITSWNASGFAVETIRDATECVSCNAEEQQLVAIVVASLVIEVVLLAGPAFAVGARRQRHDLALLAVAGGSARHVRRVVLLQAMCIGAVAALAGSGLGLVGGRVAIAVMNHFGAHFEGFDIYWPAVVAAVILGVGAAAAAAWLPSRHAARADVVTALAGRQPDPKVTAGWPVAGAIILGVAMAGSIWSSQTNDLAFSEQDAFGTDMSGYVNAWWGVAAAIGAVLLIPWVISRAATLGRRLPLPLRLALRESDRHRARTAPAIAAVMVSVAAVTALGVASSSDASLRTSLDEPEQIQPPVGTLQVSSDRLPAVVHAIAEATGAKFQILRSVPGAWIVDDEPMNDAGYVDGGGIVVATPSELEAAGVTISPAQATALDDGKVLIDRHFADTSVLLERDVEVGPAQGPLRNVFDERLDQGYAAAIMSPERAKQLKLELVDERAFASTAPAELDIRAIELAAATVDPVSWSVFTWKAEESYQNDYLWAYLVLAAAGAFAVLLGTFSATALTLTDARADMRTLGEIGAAPRTRRLVAGSHALLIALLGAGLGVLVGMTPGIVAARLVTRYSADTWTLDIPWLLFGLLLVVLPLLSGAITAAVARGPRPQPVREAV